MMSKQKQAEDDNTSSPLLIMLILLLIQSYIKLYCYIVVLATDET